MKITIFTAVKYFSILHGDVCVMLLAGQIMTFPEHCSVMGSLHGKRKQMFTWMAKAT